VGSARLPWRKEWRKLLGTGTSYVYSHCDLLTRQVSEVSGTTICAYNANGNPAAVGCPGGVSAAYGYDFANRAVRVWLEITTSRAQAMVRSMAVTSPIASVV
jgi:hypothetical protein